MNRILIGSIIVLLICAFNVNAQIVPNGDMESWVTNGAGGPPDNWTITSSMSAAQEGTIVHGGTYSASCTFTSTSNQDLIQEITTGISPDTDYNVSAWAYDNDTAGRVRLWCYWLNSSGITGSGIGSNYTTDTGTWSELTPDAGNPLTSPSDATGFRFVFRFYDVSPWDGDATLYVDDAKITEVVAGPAPVVQTAYSISDTQMIVEFDQNVDQTSAETSGNYTMSGVTFTGAARDGTDNSIVTLTHNTISADITVDTLDVDGVLPDGGGDPSDASAEFYAGIMPFSIIQQTGLTSGIFFTVRGIVSGDDEFSDVWLADGTGPWNSGFVYHDGTLDGLVDVGVDVTLVGTYDEYATGSNPSMTEIVYNSSNYYNINSTGNTPYGPESITAALIDDDFTGNSYTLAEQYEAALVTLTDVTIIDTLSSSYEYIGTDDGGINQFIIDDDAWYHYGSSSLFTEGNVYDVTGVIMYKYDQYKVCPRSAADITSKGTGTIPPFVDWEYMGGEFSNGDTNLSYHVSNSDTIHLKTGTLLSGSFYPNIPAGWTDTQRLDALTDGTWLSGDNNASLLNDNLSPNPCTVIEYDYSAEGYADISEILVFGGHDGDGTRAFINFDVAVDTGSGYTDLFTEAKTGPYTWAQQSAASAVVRLYDGAAGNLATGVQKIRFSFYDVSHNSTGWFQKYDDGTTNPPLNYPNQGAIIKEIDVLGNTAVSNWDIY